MPHYIIEHLCGHKARVRIIGPKRKRVRVLQRLTAMRCDECQRKEGSKNADAYRSLQSAKVEEAELV